MKETLFMANKNIENRNYDCFEIFRTYIIENDVVVADDIISQIILHLISFRDHFYFYSCRNGKMQTK